MLSRAKHLLLFVCGGEKQILRCAQDDPPRTLYTNTKNGLALDALDYSKTHKRDHWYDGYLLERLKARFGQRPADSITPQEIERYRIRAVCASDTQSF